MRSTWIFLATLALAGGAAGQTPPSPSAGGAEAPLEIYQIDLVPSGTGFALTKPVLEGDVYVFQVWPDRATVRLPKSKVKKMAPRTKDVRGEVLYRIDLVPSGQMIARDAPTLKGTTYRFHTWREGTLMSLRQGDVQKITCVTGMDAFKIHMQQLGAKAIGNVAMEGGGNVSVLPNSSNAPPPEPDAGMTPGQPTNWIYFGVPGITEAWAPPPAVVSAPGDVPKAPEPH